MARCLLVDAAAYVPKKRRPTKPTFSSRQKRIEIKKKRGRIKAFRQGRDDF